MKILNWIIIPVFSLQINSVSYAATVADELLSDYQQLGVTKIDAAAGEKLWHKSHGDRSCTTCHGNSLVMNGKHAKTGKIIKPMALSANVDRYIKKRKIEKWFLRNCKWTLDRECTVQEKANILSWLIKQ